jgi:hypothetical protein
MLDIYWVDSKVRGVAIFAERFFSSFPAGKKSANTKRKNQNANKSRERNLSQKLQASSV